MKKKRSRHEENIHNKINLGGERERERKTLVLDKY